MFLLCQQLGGLPYHGGPGNNYVTHAICAIVEKIRATALSCEYSRSISGIVCANGGMLTKHAIGVYSSAPRPGADKKATELYSRRDPNQYATVVNDLTLNEYTFWPSGTGLIVAWTVEFESCPNKPKRGIIIGEMLHCNSTADCPPNACRSGQRFIAVTETGDMHTMNWLLDKVQKFIVLLLITYSRNTSNFLLF